MLNDNSGTQKLPHEPCLVNYSYYSEIHTIFKTEERADCSKRLYAKHISLYHRGIFSVFEVINYYQSGIISIAMSLGRIIELILIFQTYRFYFYAKSGYHIFSNLLHTINSLFS